MQPFDSVVRVTSVSSLYKSLVRPHLEYKLLVSISYKKIQIEDALYRFLHSVQIFIGV